ncbi:MAG: substrate-binding domain-containing protein [Phycisphaeraceae bacterium JB051]
MSLMQMNIEIDHAHEEPLVKQFQRQLKANIQSRALEPGTKLPSMRKFVSEYGMSLGMVKQAINTLAAEGYLRTEQGSGVYVARRSLEQQAIALVVPAINEAIGEILSGIKEGLQIKSPRILLHDANFDFQNETQYLDQLDSAMISGAIIYPPPVSEFLDVLQSLKQRGVPFVLVDTAFDELECDSVTTDAYSMGRDAMLYLLDRGHRCIGLVELSADSANYQQMRQGISQALSEYDLNINQLPVHVTDATDLNPKVPWANGQRATLRLLGQNPQMTAIIGMNEQLALGALRAAIASGRQVPDELSVVSICDLSMFAALSPALTSFGHANHQIGFEAARLLLASIEQTGKTGFKTIKINPRVNERESVTAVRV